MSPNQAGGNLDEDLPKKPICWSEIAPIFFEGTATCAAVIGVIFLVLQWKQTAEALKIARDANRLTVEAQTRANEDAIDQARLNAAQDASEAAPQTVE